MTEVSDARARCRNCAAAMQGAYCQECGQPAFVEADRRFGHLLLQFFEAATDLDGRFWRSLRWLLLRPGALARDYLQGRRRRWLPPISLFLLINVVYFVFEPISDFNLSLEEQRVYQPWSATASAWVDARLDARRLTLDQYSASYREVSGDVGKSLLIWHVPWLSLGLMLMFVDRRLYYAEHFVVATCMMSFILALALLMALLQVLLSRSGAGGLLPTAWQTWFGLGGVTLCSISVVRQVYRASWLRTALSLPLCFIAIGAAHFSYRALQFAVTFALT